MNTVVDKTVSHDAMINNSDSNYLDSRHKQLDKKRTDGKFLMIGLGIYR